RHRGRPERPSAVDDVPVRVLIGLPRRRRALAHTGLGVVADAGREGLLQLLPLCVGERDRIAGALERLELALQHVVGLGLIGPEARRAVLLDCLVAALEGDVVAVAVGAAVGHAVGFVLDDLLRERNVAVVGIYLGQPPVLGEDRGVGET